MLDALLDQPPGYMLAPLIVIWAAGGSITVPGAIGDGVAITLSFPEVLPASDTGITGFVALIAEQFAAARQVLAVYAPLKCLHGLQSTPSEMRKRTASEHFNGAQMGISAGSVRYRIALHHAKSDCQHTE